MHRASDQGCSPGSHILNLELPVRRNSAGTMRQRLTEFLVACAVSERERADLLLAAEEALVNAFMHSGDIEGPIVVEAICRDQRAVITVTDRGCGFDSGHRDVHAVPDLFRPCGRGLFLIHALMDRVEVISGGGGTTVRMTKSIVSRS